MSGNLTKSEGGWVRLRENVASRRGIRTAQLDPRPEARRLEAEALKKKPKKRVGAVDQVQVDDDGQPFIVQNGRKRRRAFVAHNGR